MFEYEMFQARQNELIAAADHQRLVREVVRANRGSRGAKDREAGESRRSRLSTGSVRDALHIAAR